MHMNFLIVYATYSGSTQLACELLEKTLAEEKHTIIIQTAAETQLDAWEKADYIILASPSWNFEELEGQPHEDFADLFSRFAQKKMHKPFAIMGLGDSNYSIFCGAISHLEEFIKKIGGTIPAQPLKLDQYYQNEELCNQQIESWAHTLGK